MKNARLLVKKKIGTPEAKLKLTMMKKRKKLKITPMKIDKEVKDEKPELMMLFEKMKRKKVAIETEKNES